MLSAAINQKIDQASVITLKEALKILLTPHATPVFGGAKTVEHEVAALNALKHLEYLTPKAEEYELVDRLRVTKTKARSLLYQASLRTRRTEQEKVEELRKIITSGNVVAESNYFVIEVPDPLLLDDLRRRVRQSGYITDGTFSPTLARLQAAALARLIEDLIPSHERKSLESKLVKHGYKPQNIQAALTRLLLSAAEKVTNEAGAQAVGFIGAEIGEFLKEGWKTLQPHLVIK